MDDDALAGDLPSVVVTVGNFSFDFSIDNYYAFVGDFFWGGYLGPPFWWSPVSVSSIDAVCSVAAAIFVDVAVVVPVVVAVVIDVNF